MGLSLGQVAPNFRAQTTQGTIDFYESLGENWGLLFSHPQDYTPVCTTELGTVANLKSEFAKRNVKTFALSVDSLKSHYGWISDIEKLYDTTVNFPIIADQDAHIARLYGMIHENMNDTFTVRSVFIIGPDKKIRLVLTYPLSIGRNFDEILRVIDALQLSENYQVYVPANWQFNDDVIIDPSMDDKVSRERFPEQEIKRDYLKFTKQPKN